MKIKKTLVILDLESTGIWIEKDKIIEIALIKYTPEGAKETFHTRVNPGIPIPKIVTDLTGIAAKDVKDAPVFREIANKVFEFIGKADLGGFNVERFDLQLLKREFQEVGIRFEWDDCKVYDAQKVFHLNEKRDLSAAYQFYCGGGRDDLPVLEQFEYESLLNFHDEERKFCWWNGKLFPMFGKYARKTPLDEIVKSDPGYLHWVLAKDFSDNVKSVVQAALIGNLPAPKS